MTTTLGLHFPWGRYHATPWGTNVNEGRVELPPSPWRILRGLYAVWKQRQPHLDEATVHSLLAALSAPPTYFLPDYEIGHTRHYYPDTQHRPDVRSTDRAIDAFAILHGNATIYTQWAAVLTDDQHHALEQLAKSLPYLGRADSVVDANLAASTDHMGTHHPCTALLDEGDVAPGQELVRLLSPTLPLDIEALIARPVDVRTNGLLYPPGTQLVPYALPAPPRPRSPTHTAPRATTRPVQAAGGDLPPETELTAVRLTLDARPRPPMTQTLNLVEAVRRTFIERLTSGPDHNLRQPSNLIGKDTHGNPLASHHRHAHFLTHDVNEDGRIDQILIWAPGGLTDEEVTAINNAITGDTISVPAHVKGPRNIHLRISATGAATDVLPAGVLGPASVWVSTTPFLPPRHYKHNEDQLAHLTREIHREIDHRHRPDDLPHPTSIENIPGPWRGYVRQRYSKNETLAQARHGFGLRLTFRRPIHGPLILGRYAHFGLGLFHPEPTP